MQDASGEVIYIGKAKNLKKRLANYFTFRQDRDIKTRILISHITKFETIVTRTEEEALILERQLIRKLQPRYNIALKDDKNYPFIKVSTNEPFPKLSIVRYYQKDNARYFGPFPSIGSTRYLNRLLLELFPLRDCKQAISLDRKEPKCIKLDLGKCLGPCVKKEVKSDYDQMVDELCLFLQGKRQKFLTNLKAAMWRSAESLQYEKAAKYRDAIEKLQTLIQKQAVHLPEMYTIQVWVMAENDTHRYALVQTFVEGQLLFQNGFYEEKGDSNYDAFLDRAILHFFGEKSDENTPRVILCDTFFYHALKPIVADRIRLLMPKRKAKAEVLKSAKRNAELALLRIYPEQVEDTMQVLKEVQTALKLEKPPIWMWCIDISHFQGEEIVGALVVFLNGKPHKKSYRKFLIQSTKGTSHDPLSIYEVLFRQVSKLHESELEKPDLVVIDGGKGQLRFAGEALLDLGVYDMSLVALAKKEEDIYFPNQTKPLKLKHHTNVVRLLQRIRNEAHRFAITFQRSRRKLKLASVFSEIKGIGKVKMAAIYTTFKTIEEIAKSETSHLAAVAKITPELAEKVKHAANDAATKKGHGR